MKVLVIGAAGQVGAKVSTLALAKGHSVVGTIRSRSLDIPGVEAFPLDKSDRPAVDDLVRRVRPDIVVDTGALHNVDYCESHPDEALRVNRDGTGFLSDACAREGARFIFLSTDYVFDGSGHPPYSEGDEPAPQSAYARSKLEAEHLVLAAGRDTAVVRPSVIYSWTPMEATNQSSSGKPLNFGSWFVRQLLAGKEVRIVTDQVGSPTLADDLAGAVLALAGRADRGLFHAAGTTHLSRFDFCVQVAQRLGLPVDLVRPVRTSDLRQAAVRPSNSSLRSDLLRQAVNYEMKDLDGALAVFAGQMSAEPPEDLRGIHS